MIDQTIIQIAEYSRILSQIVLDVQERNYLNERAPGNITKTQFTILKLLFLADSYTVSKLADILNISRAAVSKNIEKLVRTKLVKRKITQTDRRTTHISLTEKGKNIIEDFDKVKMEKQLQALSQFSQSEQRMLSKLLGDYVRSYINHESDIELICLQCNGSISKECALTEHKKRCRFYYNSNKISTK